MKMKANLFSISLFAISSIFTTSAMHLDKHLLGQQLIEAAKQNNLQKMQQLINDGADINAKDNEGCTALMKATRYGQTNALKLLIKNGANINAKNNDGWTTLMLAASYGQRYALKLLIENGADINAKNDFCLTALMNAAFDGHTDALTLLIENGADINAKDNEGWTALMKAAKWHKQSCCERLVEAMIAQEKAPFCFLFCWKKAKQNQSILACLPKDIAQLIAKRCWNETIATREEINKITNTKIKQNLLEKYFPKPKNN